MRNSWNMDTYGIINCTEDKEKKQPPSNKAKPSETVGRFCGAVFWPLVFVAKKQEQHARSQKRTQIRSFILFY